MKKILIMIALAVFCVSAKAQDKALSIKDKHGHRGNEESVQNGFGKKIKLEG